ncbi:MAG: adenylate cyclase [Arcticibacterium sp.]|jgi:adenylate cyclase
MALPKSQLAEKLDELIDGSIKDGGGSIDFLIEKIGISRSKLYRIVKESHNRSIGLYIRHRRLLKAKELLTSTELRVSEVAYAVGIDIPQNFSKYFTNAFSISPSDYRKEALIKIEEEQSTTPKHSIAVLPFVNRGSQEQEYFSDGITEEIINALSQVSQIKVAGRTSSFRFKGKNPDLKELGGLLGVNFILEGSVRWAKDKLRITARLIKIADGFLMWSQTFDRTIIDVFDIQDEISLAILEEIKIKLLGDQKEIVLKRTTNNTASYQLYLQGRYFHYKMADDSVFYKAIDFYKAAIQLEPNYANAYAGIAHCYMHLWFFSELAPAKSVMLAKEAIEKALLLDSNNADAHNADAEVKLWYNWNFKAAEIAFKKAESLNPNLPELHMHYGMYYGFTEQYDLCDKHFESAIRLDPFSVIYYSNWGLMKWMQGDMGKALELAEKSIFKMDDFFGGYFLKALVLIEQKQYKEALPFVLNARNHYPSGNTIGLLALVNIFLGEADEAKVLIKEVEERVANGLACNYDLAQLYIATGEFLKAHASFEKAHELHEGRMLMIHQAFRKARYFKSSPEFKKFFDAISKLSEKVPV